MREYRIAFFTVDWNCELVENTMHGLKKYIRDHENVRVCVFDCFGSEVDNAKSRIEYGIFELADLADFDGLLIQGNQVVLKEARENISRRVIESGIPAVSIDCPMEGCAFLGLDNRSAQHDITEHVIRSHGARRLVYLTGIMNNGSPSGRLRMEGFLDACREAGISESCAEVIECSWKAQDGTRVAEMWLQEGRELPDAFICANDEMALAMLETFASNGISVPKDVIITGFDNVSSAILSDPQLTTVNRDFDLATYLAMETVVQMIENGAAAGEGLSLPYQVIHSQSCGCQAAVRPQDTVRLYFKRSRFLKGFHTEQARLTEQLLDVPDISHLMSVVGGNHDVLSCDMACLCVNDYYYDNYDKDNFRHDTESFGENMILVSEDDDGSIREERFPAGMLLPEHLLEKERFLVFYPIHYNTWSIGYLVLNDISEAAQLNLHRNLFSFLEIAVENVRKKGLLRYLNQMLDRLYVKDRLTGLFNRSGYERFAEEICRSFIGRDGGAQIIFIDMDGLKGINDRYGHDMGDEAIRESASILSSVCGHDDFVMRFGGDEFLVITSVLRSGFEEELRANLRKENERRNRPFDLSMSVGIIRTDKDSGKSLEEYIQEADTLMYRNKKHRRGT
ncbi:MAG: GGDEF domain-containing protein [Lachnospiraceae bacterium]|nr:GGDEF domain-containing protein [Lachnospiraceae bacterium]